MADRMDLAVQDFAKTLGINELSFPASGVIHCTFEQAGDFFLEKLGDGILLYLVREVADFQLGAVARKALSLCHFNNSQIFDIQCALKDSNQLLFLVFVTEDRLDGRFVDKALNALVRLHDVAAER